MPLGRAVGQPIGTAGHDRAELQAKLDQILGMLKRDERRMALRELLAQEELEVEVAYDHDCERDLAEAMSALTRRASKNDSAPSQRIP